MAPKQEGINNHTNKMGKRLSLTFAALAVGMLSVLEWVPLLTWKPE